VRKTETKVKTGTKIYIFLGVFFATLLGIAVLVGNSGKKAGFRNLEEIISAGKLRVVSENSNVGFTIENDSISGFQYEILKIFADSLGVELEISVNNDLHESIAKLQRGKYDIIAKLVPITIEWIDVVSFSEPLFVSRQMLVQRVSEDEEFQLITQQYELVGDSIFIPRNSPHKMRLTHLSDEIADAIHIVEMENQNAEQLIALAAEGKIRHTIAHEQLARKITRQYSNLDASLPVSFSQSYGWIVNKKSDELLEKLNEFLSDFIGSAEYWRLYRKYY
jgi:membrane-bound lytic murein transglycosylase F